MIYAAWADGYEEPILLGYYKSLEGAKQTCQNRENQNHWGKPLEWRELPSQWEAGTYSVSMVVPGEDPEPTTPPPPPPPNRNPLTLAHWEAALKVLKPQMRQQIIETLERPSPLLKLLEKK